MGDRARRVGMNEALFRAVNERIEDLNDSFAEATDCWDVVCECGDISCVERLALSRSEYQQLRADAELFAVVRGHEDAAVETVIEGHGRYVVIRKDPGVPARLARETA